MIAKNLSGKLLKFQKSQPYMFFFKCSILLFGCFVSVSDVGSIERLYTNVVNRVRFP